MSGLRSGVKQKSERKNAVEPKKQFWLIWKEGGTPPVMLHLTLARVQKEAERLAKKQPGDRFFILEARASIVGENEMTTTWNVIGEPEISHTKENP